MHVLELIAEVAVTEVFEKERHFFFMLIVLILKISKVSWKCQGLVMDLGTIGFDIQEQVVTSHNE